QAMTAGSRFITTPLTTRVVSPLPRSMDWLPRNTVAWLCAWIGVVGCVSGGGTCGRKRGIPDVAPPVRFQAAPSLAELTTHINHSLAVTRLESNTMTITSPDVSAKLARSLAWERPHNFSLQAYPGTRLLGLAFAAGSNAD